MKITGGSGSGKTSQVLIPLILSGAKIVIIFDFKNGEITRVIEPHCALSGIPLHVFDPYEITDFPRTRISLLSHLKANSPQLFLDVKRLWKTLAPDSIGDNSYFDKAARRYGFAITMADIVLTEARPFRQSLPWFRCCVAISKLGVNGPQWRKSEPFQVFVTHLMR
ncbi:MAG: type IV secretory system conjugative DNA transfer family protein [Pseudomonadota bacterium]